MFIRQHQGFFAGTRSDHLQPFYGLPEAAGRKVSQTRIVIYDQGSETQHFLLANLPVFLRMI
jgi:hypothetical protein